MGRQGSRCKRPEAGMLEGPRGLVRLESLFEAGDDMGRADRGPALSERSWDGIMVARGSDY